ncbi:MAG: HlyC/CorC family transporter [Actinobacteria bacterium]|nr:HlyC/CorC family transporter [Actinomycetota bacterium]
MQTGDRVALAASALIVLLTALLVLVEASMVRVSRIRALAWAEEERRGAARLARLVENPDRIVAVFSLVRTALRIAAATAVGIVGWRQGGAGGAALAVGTLTALLLVVAELVPRRLVARVGDVVACRAAGPTAALLRLAPLAMLARMVVTPDVRNGNGGAEEADEGDADEEIDKEEAQLIHSVFEFGDTVVREVMVPRTDMVAVRGDATVDDALDVAIPAGFSRLPVYRDTVDRVVGTVFVKDLIRAARSGQGGQPATTVLRKAVFIPEQKRVAELLREMQTRKFHLAIAVDEYGGTAGLVTLEDVLEEIVGEITDEYDVEETRVEELEGGVLRVAGRTPIDEINDLLGVELPSAEWDTVGGLIFDLVGHVPAEGESVSFQGIDFVAERVQGRRIVSVQVRAAGARAGDRPAASR